MPNGRFDLANRRVLGVACIKILTRATVHGKRLNAGTFGDPGNLYAVATRGIPTGADLERYGHRYCA